METENREIMQNLDMDIEDMNRHQARRAARLARLREEKRRQERRRRMLKKYLPLGIGAFVLLIACIVGISLFVGGKKGKEQTDAYEEQTASAEMESSADLTAEEHENGETGEGTSESVSENAAAEEEETVKEPVTWEFAFTPDTTDIVSEEVISSHAILVDESTDTVIAQKKATERISPASMTKVLTVLTAAELIPEEKLDDTFAMTLEITDYAYVNDCSCVGFLKDEQVTVRDLFYGTILPSGADAAVGLAFYAAGSHEAFVEKMNEKLTELGVAETTHFTNCVGIYDEEHYSTVYDMAIIMKAAMQNPLCREVLSARTYTTAPTQEHPEGIVISNWFLRRIEDKDTGGDVIGAKTGFVVQSKNCAVSYGSFGNGTPYVCATAGSSSSWRCIYDHVEIYNRYIPGNTEDNGSQQP